MQEEICNLLNQITNVRQKWKFFLTEMKQPEELEVHTELIESVFEAVNMANSLIQKNPNLNFTDTAFKSYVEKWIFLEKKVENFIEKYRKDHI